MGCCSSRVDGAVGPHHDGSTTTTGPLHPPYRQASASATESARAITAASPARPASSTSNTQSHGPPRSNSHSTANPTAAATTGKSLLPNSSLRPVDPKRRCKLPDPFTIPTSTASQNPGLTPWTRAKLERERQDWWDTRDSGSREIWQAYRAMVAHAQAGEIKEAQTLLDAVGCTCPTGKLWHAIYDERGVEYAIRDGRRNYEWLVFEPSGLLGEGEVDSTEDKGKTEVDGGNENESGAAKGKGKARAEDKGKVVKARCRLSSTGRDHYVDYRKGEPIGSIMEALTAITGLEAKRHRISYLGRLYAAHEPLPTEGERAWKEQNVLTVLVMEGP